MTTASQSLFDSVIPGQPAPRVSSPAAPAKAAPISKAGVAAAMPASLWRHTQNEEAAESRHGLVTRGVLAVIGVLSLGSIAYAAWQTGVLMSGNHLHDAVSAFLR